MFSEHTLKSSCAMHFISSKNIQAKYSLKHSSFYRIPSGTDKESLELRHKWVSAIRRENWLEKQTDNARICSSHFITGKCS